VISDTHDSWNNIEAFVNKFIDEEKVDAVFHCGDIVAPFMKTPFNRLNELNIPLYAVYGNNDGERRGLKTIFGAKDNSFQIKGDYFDIELEGIKILVFHHFEEQLVESLAKSGSYNLILKGHTHQIRNERIGSCLIVNPGEGCGYLTKKATAAIVDLPDLKVKFIEL
jgi:putative phosphoesterase